MALDPARSPDAPRAVYQPPDGYRPLPADAAPAGPAPPDPLAVLIADLVHEVGEDARVEFRLVVEKRGGRCRD